MEEIFASGYCRAIDRSRTVTAEKEDGRWHTDCGRPTCPYAPTCPILRTLEDKLAPGDSL